MLQFINLIFMIEDTQNECCDFICCDYRYQYLKLVFAIKNMIGSVLSQNQCCL